MKKLIGGIVVVLIGASCLAVSAASSGQWVGTWAAPPIAVLTQPYQHTVANTTYRNIAHISLGGKSLRVELTNEFGTDTLLVGSVHVASSAGGGAIVAGTDHRVTFGGTASVRIPPGAMIVSDPVALSAPAFADIAVSVYLPAQAIAVPTCHALAESNNYLTNGNTTGALSLQDATKYQSWCFVKGIEVQRTDSAAIVTLGDSITDGYHSTIDANRRWPDVLAARLAQRTGSGTHYAVLNAGISGNCLLRNLAYDGSGVDAAARFDRDVISQSGVKYLIILEGINDIDLTYGIPGTRPDPTQFTNDLIGTLKQLILRAHQHGIKVYVGTITPGNHTVGTTDTGELVREHVNAWIRTGGASDGVIDFDKVLRDPNNPTSLLKTYDSGDHLHPSDAGYKAMGDAIDLRLFE